MSVRSPVAPDRLSVPACLRPELASDMLPTLEVPDLAAIQRAGWRRVGIVAAVVDPQQRILMLEHKGSDKSLPRALGPLAETTDVRVEDGKVTIVESTMQTLARSIDEELGVQDPTTLGLRARRVGAWILHEWPVGIAYPGQSALAVCPIVHIGDNQRDKLLDVFHETDEITDICFKTWDEIVACKSVRPGTHGWLLAVVASGLIEPDSTVRAMPLSHYTPPDNTTSINFDKMGHNL